MKSWLRSIPLLYLLFVLSLVHLGFILIHGLTESLVFFVLVGTMTFLYNPNMIFVLATTILVVDILYLARKVKKEGFELDLSGIDVSGIDISGIDVSGSYLSYNEGLENSGPTPKHTRYLETAVKNIFKESSAGNDLEEIQEDFVNMKNVVENAKEASPELAEELKNSHTIDIQEFNTLINRLNRMVSNVTD